MGRLLANLGRHKKRQPGSARLNYKTGDAGAVSPQPFLMGPEA